MLIRKAKHEDSRSDWLGGYHIIPFYICIVLVFDILYIYMCMNIYIYVYLPIFTHFFGWNLRFSRFFTEFSRIFLGPLCATGLHCDSWAAVNRAPRVFQRPCASLPRIVAAPKKGDCFIEYQRDMMGIWIYIYVGYIITNSMEYGFVQTWWIPDFLPLNWIWIGQFRYPASIQTQIKLRCFSLLTLPLLCALIIFDSLAGRIES